MQIFAVASLLASLIVAKEAFHREPACQGSVVGVPCARSCFEPARCPEPVNSIPYVECPASTLLATKCLNGVRIDIVLITPPSDAPWNYTSASAYCSGFGGNVETYNPLNKYFSNFIQTVKSSCAGEGVCSSGVFVQNSAGQCVVVDFATGQATTSTNPNYCTETATFTPVLCNVTTILSADALDSYSTSSSSSSCPSSSAATSSSGKTSSSSSSY